MNVTFRVSWLRRPLSAAMACGAIVICVAQAASAPNTLSEQERADGWTLLFDGKTSEGWREFMKSDFPTKGWVIEDGILKLVAGERGGNLVSTRTFEDFELTWEWRIPPGANNGVKYFILEERRASIGHEYQMIDDTGKRISKGVTASFYDVLPPREDRVPVRINEWNQSRILVDGQRVEHWLNGQKVLEYELGSPEVLAAVAKSKFKNVKKFGTKVRGRIVLTDHGSEAWYRSIKLREP